MRRSCAVFFQSGVHIPHGVRYASAARMRGWPAQKIPDNFAFLEEQRFRAKAMPRDTGKIPRNFVLSVLYRHQPCEVSTLWQRCASDPQTVLDSKHHLRQVLQQARAEGFISFERDAITQRWTCALTRERCEEVRGMVEAANSSMDQHSGLRGSSATETANLAEHFHSMNEAEKKEHLQQLSQQVEATTERLRQHQRTTIDYLPYTDLNGAVKFMWWYESAMPAEPAAALPEAAPGDAQLES